jgi:Family of unknown function (DUF6502)
MEEATQPVLVLALRRLLRPLVRILLRHGMSFARFAEEARAVFVDVAEQEFELPGRQQTVSRISIITGLTRKEVRRVKQRNECDAADRTAAHNRAARVIGGWVRDHAGAEGASATLPLDGSSQSFADLVRRHSGDMPVRAVLDELIRVGAVERTNSGEVRLLTRGYVPQTGDPDRLAMLGRDARDLISSVEHNLSAPPPDRYYQRIVAYDNLPADFLPALRSEAAKRGQALLEQLDRCMAPKDRDVRGAPERGADRRRAVIGVYYFEEDMRPRSLPPLRRPSRPRAANLQPTQSSDGSIKA